MAKRTVIWTKTATLQLRATLRFWIDHNLSTPYAHKLLDKIEDVVDGIQRHPQRSPLSIYSDVRVAVMHHYSLFYRITPQRIVIVAFWDNRQDPAKLLKLLRTPSK
jgi:plasmid stabilization system protein ParE